MIAIRRIAIACCFAVIFCSFCAGGPAAVAQSSCFTWIKYSFPDQPAAPGSYDCQQEGPWMGVCKIKTGCPTEICLTCLLAGRPINLANGNTEIAQTDVSVPGLGGGLTLTRTWNSVWPSGESAFSTTGVFGLNWRSTYEERVFVGGDGFVKYLRGDGSFWSFAYVSAGSGTGPVYTVVAPANAAVTLVAGSSQWTLTFKDGEQRVFDATSGSLLSIVDRNGNTTQLTYDSANRLITVADPASRHLYFNYSNPSNMYLVTSVTSDFGISTSYAYDSSGRLTQVTRPDGTTWSFQYNAQSLITAVLDNEEKVLESHTYDSQGRGLTSSRAGGVEAVTVSYP